MTRYVVIGCGAAASAAAETLRQADADASITLMSFEKVRVLARPRLVEYASGVIDLFELETRDQKWFDDLRLDVRLETRATQLDPARRRVTLSTGEELAYDKLLLTLGMATRPVPFEGGDLRGVCQMHFQPQADVVRGFAATTNSSVVVGGGLLGQDMAAALHAAGIKTTLLVREDRIGVPQFDPGSGGMLLDELRSIGVDVRLQTEVARIEGADGRVGSVVTRAGEMIACQLVLVAIGAMPNTEWLKPTGLEVGRGIVVDEHLATSLPDVFAAGSCAEIHAAGRTLIQASWLNATAMGRTAARNMLGQAETYREPSSYTTKVGNTMFTLFGSPIAAYPVARYVTFRGPDGSYAALVAEGGLVRGGMLVGRHKKAKAIKELPLRDDPVPGLAEASGEQAVGLSEFISEALGLG
ncbi:MAG: FAD-dependent oxidoreductase [Planctomycetes bacterium]|nr:FAD-dependent oxidoreductase [Planctomycetota bacterium]